ncbi:hypothetical protein DFQ01_101420 [Paenibacillus cellulosilyticus]|uniref:Uncharacterized protein n=1 Tax=Paenibacillus cellulosilyticus TaxID=375489 RepID=A0A2V2Z0U2_9BACL|nr:hypothetical protein [Paenibacillus cellulosilyticus]PWW08694.1 hypothetical protein DFQ01_101420 [Paenibacillus cellulosilyticus]QKS48260.1 hypothetical protein HUB94_28720 [Paenibacillus cellulosilyticus]
MFIDRDHPRGMEDLFPSLSDPEQARSKTLDNVVNTSNHYLQQAQQHGVQYFIRNASTQLEDRLANVERHFGLR